MALSKVIQSLKDLRERSLTLLGKLERGEMQSRNPEQDQEWIKELKTTINKIEIALRELEAVAHK